MTNESVKYICPECGSDQIVREATVIWDHLSQGWVVQSVYDDCFCSHCDREVDPDAVALSEEG